MTSLARRELVATIVSLAGTALPFGIGGGDDREEESGGRGDGPERRGDASNERGDESDDRSGEPDDRNGAPDDGDDKPEGRADESDDRGEESDGRDGDVDGADLTGVVDRIEGEMAVVLLERAEETVGQRLVPVGRLPADAREAGAVLSVTLADGEIERLRYDADATRRRRDAAQDRFDELAEDATEAS